MIKHRWLAAGLASATAALAPASAQQPSQTVQQAFETAAALDAGTDRAKALAAWEALDRRTARNPRSHAIVLVRKSGALYQSGRRDEAIAAARLGLAGLPAGDPSLDGDRYLAWMVIGQVARSVIDYAGAGEAFARAEPLATAPGDKLGALMGLIATKTFTDPDAALAASTRADTILGEIKPNPQTSAAFASAKGVLLMNRGEMVGAREETQRAVKLLGGLTTMTRLDDVSARSNAAIALLLSGKKDDARRFMAMTGAGRLTRGEFDPAAEMTPPDCGGEAGLKPADMAVIEFSIGDDGTVILAEPVYAAGGGAVAQEFARAARRWSWTPEQVKQLPAFFRYNVRVEMRCSLAFERPSVEAGLFADLVAWLETKGQSVAEKTGADAAMLVRQRAALAAASAKRDGDLAVLAAIVPILNNVVVGREERGTLAARAHAIAVASGAPATGQLALDMTARLNRSADGYDPGNYRRTMTPLLTAAPYGANPEARAAVALLIADYDRKRPSAASRRLLRAVADDAALAKNHALRTGALIRLASIAQMEGDVAAARTAFEQSGLAADQCAILDKPPKLQHAGGSFPEEARMWGFEGWTRTQFDIDAAGKVRNERAIVSYPPFVFTKAGVDTMRGATYAKTFRPDGGLGCGASTQGVRFTMGS